MLIRRDDEQDRVEIQMAPMIDCVFLLLIFFLVTASLKKPHRELQITLPYASAAKVAKMDFDQLILSVNAEGEVFINGRLLTEQQLLHRLELASSRDPKPRVRIDGDQQARYFHIARLANLCQVYGLNTVGLRINDNAGGGD